MNKQILSLTVILSLCATVVAGQSKDQGVRLRVNQDRIEKRIMELATYGRDEKGHGYRVAFTKGDQEGRAWYMDQLRNAGLEVSVDYAGNIIARRPGSDLSLMPIAFGSHIDMVPDGGNYDGCVGSISALEVVEVLKENKLVTRHPLQIMIFSNEEGGTVGSSALAGHLTKDDLQTRSQSGLTMAEGIKAIGGDPEKIDEVKGRKGDLAAFLELHIEQGGFLEQDHVQIGVVEGIVGIGHWDVVFEGFANHAGTTPMHGRKDALLAAARFVIAVNEVVNSHDGRQVGTVGRIQAEPGAPNVIPGKVTASLELRDLSNEKIEMLYTEIKKRADTIAAGSGVKISFSRSISIKPALTNEGIKSQIIESARTLGLSYQNMPSGAGHDSQEIAAFAPVGMIFVPSRGGISHSPDEFTSAIDMANGANVLLQTILAIDNK